MRVKGIATATILASAILIITSCSSDYQRNLNTVTLHELSDAEMLNPVNYSDATAGYILTNLFQSLISIDFKTLELVPVIAESRPEIESTEDGGMRITYRIRQEAKWDNGTQITPQDVAFTLKVIKNPKVNNHRLKPYYEFISDIQYYEDDPLKFTLICNSVYILSESSSGTYSIMPEYFYDPKGLMKDFTIKELTENSEALLEDPKINEFATEFNSEKWAREKDFIGGSGAYKLVEWTTGQRVVLEKKKDWWGDQFADKNCFFEAFPEKLIYQTVNDQTSAIVSLKAGNLDVMHSIKSKDFVELPKSEKFTENYNSHTPMMLAYSYIGLNTKNPKLSDKKVRQALAHLVNVDKMIETVAYGLAERVIGPIHPSRKKDYNSDIVPYDYNIEKAKTMLAEAGWEDTNGNGTIDKEIDGQQVEFEVDFSINSGNDARKQVALMFQEEARKVGITVNVNQQDWSVYLDNQKKQKFEISYGAWIGSPTPQDFKQIFHTESSLNEGSNYVSFGNAESDALIDSIRVTLDEDKRAELNKKFQALLYDETSYIFLWAPLEKIAIHKRFENADPSIARPGFWEAGFKLVPEASAAK